MAKTKPFLPTLNAIRSAQPGDLKGHAVAEAFDQVSSSIQDLHDLITGLKSGSTTVVQQSSATAASSSNTPPAPTTASSFSALTTGTNNGALMIVGAGARLDYTGVGIVNASSIQGVTISGLPVVGYVPIATSPTTAVWSPLGMITTLDCMSSTGLIGGLDCGDLS